MEVRYSPAASSNHTLAIGREGEVMDTQYSTFIESKFCPSLKVTILTCRRELKRDTRTPDRSLYEMNGGAGIVMESFE